MCDCGSLTKVLASNLRSGNTKSCGCRRRSVTREKATKHGLASKRIYWQWNNIMRRCYDPKFPAYKDYGGRGISVDPRWHNVESFYADVGDKPEGMSIDRVDNNANYGPGNWRWATQKEQVRNTRRNVHITHRGETKTLVEWSEIWGIPYSRLWVRVKLGWPHSQLNLPKRPKRVLVG